MIFPQLFFVVSPYKDPVKNHHMKEFSNKIITGFFVLIFGILWFFSTKYYVKPQQYTVLIYDCNDNKINPIDIRTKFSTQEVAFSYIKEYQKNFPDLKFFLESILPKFKRRLFRNIKKFLQVM